MVMENNGTIVNFHHLGSKTDVKPSFRLKQNYGEIVKNKIRRIPKLLLRQICGFICYDYSFQFIVH